MQRSKYTAEFKAEAVKQVVDKGHTVVDVASRQGLGEGGLYNWVRKSKAPDGALLGDMRAMQAGVAKLKAELRRTTEERDIETAQVMEELIEMAKKFRDASNRGKHLGQF